MGLYFMLMILCLVLVLYMSNRNKETEKFGLVDVDDIMFKKDKNVGNIYDYTKVDKRK